MCTNSLTERARARYVYVYIYTYIERKRCQASSYIYIYIHTHIYIYIYIERERERDVKPALWGPKALESCTLGALCTDHMRKLYLGSYADGQKH